jgi:hypothetical protein
MDKANLDYDYFDKASEFLKVSLNEFAYALNYRLKEFKDQADPEVKKRVSKDFYTLMETKIKTKQNLWTSESHDHQVCFLELLSFGRVITALEKNVEAFILHAFKIQQIASVPHLLYNLF